MRMLAVFFGLLCAFGLVACGKGAGKGGGAGRAEDDGKSIQIVSVSFGVGESTPLMQRNRKVIVSVKNKGLAPAQLWIGNLHGEKISKEQHEGQVNMSAQDRKDVGLSDEDLKLPYCLGLEGGDPAKDKWYHAITTYRWVPAPKSPQPVPTQVTIAPGQTSDFSVIVPDKNDMNAAKAYRVYLVNKDYKRIDEKVLQ